VCFDTNLAPRRCRACSAGNILPAMVVYWFELRMKLSFLGLSSASPGPSAGPSAPGPQQPQLRALLLKQVAQGAAFVACYATFVYTMAPSLTPAACGAAPASV
jgi:hypothetical protein